MTKIINTNILDDKNIKTILDAIKQSKLCILPTETVYGIFVCSNDASALLKIFQIKKRSLSKPVALLFYSIKSAMNLIIDNPNYQNKLTTYQIESIERILQFGCTIVVPKYLDDTISNDVKNKDIAWSTIGIRVPQGKLIRKILRMNKSPLYGTSANKSSEESISKFDKINSEILNNIEIAVKDDSLVHGIESTVIKFEKNCCFKIIRKGSFLPEIEEILRNHFVEDI